MQFSPEFYQAAAALFKLLTPLACIAFHLIKRKFPLTK